MREEYQRTKSCPIDSMKLLQLPNGLLQLATTPAGTSDTVLSERLYRSVDDFNTDFFSDFIAPGVLIKEACPDLRKLAFEDQSGGTSEPLYTDSQLIEIAEDAGVSDYNPDRVNEELLKVNELLNRISDIREDQRIDAQTIEDLKIDLYKKRETIKQLLDTVKQLQTRNTALEERIRKTDLLLADCQTNLNKAFLSEKSKYDSKVSNYSWSGRGLDSPGLTSRFERKTKDVNYLDPSKTYIHQTVIPYDA